MTWIIILLAIIAVAEISGATCQWITYSDVTKRYGNMAEQLNSDVRAQRDISNMNFKNWQKAAGEVQILRQKVSGTAFEEFKKVLNEKLAIYEVGKDSDKYEEAAYVALKSLADTISTWENQFNDESNS